jgi:hypothetical protein
MADTPTVSPTLSRILEETQPWVRLMGILGFVSVGFMIVAAAVAGAVGVATENAEAAVLMFVYPLLALVYVVPSYYLVRSANRLRDFAARGEASELEAALDAQRAFWKFVGVLALIGIAATLALMVVGVMVGLTAVGRS